MSSICNGIKITVRLEAVMKQFRETDNGEIVQGSSMMRHKGMG